MGEGLQFDGVDGDARRNGLKGHAAGAAANVDGGENGRRVGTGGFFPIGSQSAPICACLTDSRQRMVVPVTRGLTF